MQVVREQFALAKAHGLFRAASAVDVTWIIAWEVLGAERTNRSPFSRSFEALQQVSEVQQQVEGKKGSDSRSID